MWNRHNGHGGTTVVVERDQFAILPPNKNDVVDGEIVWTETFEPYALQPTSRDRQTTAPATGQIPSVTWG